MDSRAFTSPHAGRDGSTVAVEVQQYAVATGDGPVGGTWTMVRDVSDRKAGEQERLLWQQKLAHMARVHTIGEMASQLAHELSQPLFAIHVHADVALRTLEGGHANLKEARDDLKAIQRSVERAEDILAQLRDFVLHREVRRSDIEISALMTETVAFLKPLLRDEDTKITLNLPGNAIVVHVNRTQIEQVLVNLIRNALHALGTAGTANPEIILHVRPLGGREVRLQVIDNGPGVHTDNIPHLFDLFFTTDKEGTGMGLPIVRTIVEAHGGRLWYQANPEGWAIFQFTLPVSEKDTSHDT